MVPNQLTEKKKNRENEMMSITSFTGYSYEHEKILSDQFGINGNFSLTETDYVTFNVPHIIFDDNKHTHW